MNSIFHIGIAVIIFLWVGSIHNKMDLLLTETSLQLQAVADGCLNKIEGE